MLVLMLACTLRPTSDSDASDSGFSTDDSGHPGAGGCDEQEDVWYELESWDDLSPQGAMSANHFFEFAIGPFVDSLNWDDGTASKVTQSATRGSAWEVDGGDGPCNVSLVAQGTWAVMSDDGRLDLSVPFEWSVEDQEPDQNIGSADVRAVLDVGDVGVVPLQMGSTFHLDVVVRTDGSLALVITETWELNASTTRECQRASAPGSPEGCWDVKQTPPD